MSRLRFLADESCDRAVVAALRGAGHEVVAVADVGRGAADSEVIALAGRERRTLLTEDKDFGQLYFASLGRAAGVVLIRFPAPARSSLPAAAVEAVERLGPRMERAFTVIQPGRVRIVEEPKAADS